VRKPCLHKGKVKSKKESRQADIPRSTGGPHAGSFALPHRENRIPPGFKKLATALADASSPCTCRIQCQHCMSKTCLDVCACVRHVTLITATRLLGISDKTGRHIEKWYSQTHQVKFFLHRPRIFHHIGAYVGACTLQPFLACDFLRCKE
jgi:hypothetical protein